MREDLAGKRIYRFVIQNRDTSFPRRDQWICLCDCGEVRSIHANALRSGMVFSCGCLRREKSKAGLLNRKHGHAAGCGSREYRSWECAKNRITNPKLARFDRYGGRGISMSHHWFNSFENFLKDMGPRPPGMTLERINNDGNYEPSNCKWATKKEQALNRAPWTHRKKTPKPVDNQPTKP